MGKKKKRLQGQRQNEINHPKANTSTNTIIKDNNQESFLPEDIRKGFEELDRILREDNQNLVEDLKEFAGRFKS